MKSFLIFAFLIHNAYSVTVEGAARKTPADEYVKSWSCNEKRCIRSNGTNTDSMSYDVCKLTCGYGTLWPLPSGKIEISDTLIPVNPNSISFQGKSLTGENISPEVEDIIRNLKKISYSRLISMVTKTSSDETKSISLTLNLKDVKKYSLTHDTDESYKLSVTQNSDGRMIVNIEADNYFGARHGVETLHQLIVYDQMTENLVIPKEISITDEPKYKYRGILVDTARNFISVPYIKMTLDAMAVNKLNSFHWHLTDTHSFPFYSKTYPQLSKLGAYSQKQVYQPEDVKSIIEYGRLRGIRIIPEFDAPAHVGEGWQWVGDDALVCFRSEPWQSYCVEPPCGQLNPTSNKTYEILKGIYTDYMDLFEYDLFHMGGDEVNINCWNSSEAVTKNMHTMGFERTVEGFHQLWSTFQSRAFGLLDEIKKKPHKAILWTSSLTGKHIKEYLDPKDYIIQIWTKKDDDTIANLVNNGYEVILSNYDALYFDCGFGAWVGTGNNWCSPYIPWQTVYENDPEKILNNLKVDVESKKHLIAGSEAAIWTEQVDDSSLNNRLWPRGNAMAEALWTGAQGSWKDAEDRMMYQRQRMVDLGLFPDTLRPQWCNENEGSCYI